MDDLVRGAMDNARPCTDCNSTTARASARPRATSSLSPFEGRLKCRRVQRDPRRAGRLFQPRPVVRHVVRPLEPVCPRWSGCQHQGNFGSAVGICVPQQQLAAVQVAHVLGIPVEAQRALSFGSQTELETHELLQEGRLHFQLHMSALQKLRRLPQAPSVLCHHVGTEYAAGAGLAVERVDQDPFCKLDSLLNKVENFIGHLVSRVKNNLAGSVDPVVGQVANAEGRPAAWDLLAAAVDDVGNLVLSDSFQVLRSRFTSEEQPIYDFQPGRRHLYMLSMCAAVRAASTPQNLHHRSCPLGLSP
mmetsp:Transcript_16239/g.50857  ORF Transcript_16239/g.50857 Transcript_16239/m.50857 type:complete len:303 (-) Transcript_16239:8-916(-)